MTFIMKHSIFTLLFLLFTSLVFSQENSMINLGVGSPFFGDTNDQIYNHKFSFPRADYFIELPALFFLNKPKDLFVTPGLRYFNFNEEISSGGGGGQSTEKVNRTALSLYSKFLINFGLGKQKSTIYYFGFISGVYLKTKTTGEISWRLVQEELDYYGHREINESGKRFFSKSYSGFIFGVKSRQKKKRFLNPGLEASYFPNFAGINTKINNYETPVTSGMANLSLTLGFGTKKSSSKN